MKEKPILLNADMVRAVLDGRKTQTRRIMRVQPSADFHPMNMKLETDFTARWYTPGVVDKDGYLQPGKNQVFGVASEDEGYVCPFGAVGDRLWVREAWQVIHDYIDEHGNVDERRYARSIPKQRGNYWHPVYSEAWGDENKECRGFPWRPSIHMPRWASRITLEITGVRVERLWDITEDDAKAEGCTFKALRFKPGTREVEEMGHTAVYQFGGLWQSIYGDESWQANPWVWVIEFKRVEE